MKDKKIEKIIIAVFVFLGLFFLAKQVYADWQRLREVGWIELTNHGIVGNRASQVWVIWDETEKVNCYVYSNFDGADIECIKTEH